MRTLISELHYFNVNFGNCDDFNFGYCLISNLKNFSNFIFQISYTVFVNSSLLNVYLLIGVAPETHQNALFVDYKQDCSLALPGCPAYPLPLQQEWCCMTNLKYKPGNTKGEVSLLLTSCLTGLGKSVLPMKTKIVSNHTADSKPVKQEVNSTVILPPLVSHA